MRARATFDTLAYANRLKAAGMDPSVAEVQAEASADLIAGLLDDTLATKQDNIDLNNGLKQEIAAVHAELKQEITAVRAELKQEIAELRAELKQEIAELRAELKQEIAELRTELRTAMKDLETRLTLRFGGIVIGGMTVMTAFLTMLHVVH